MTARVTFTNGNVLNASNLTDSFTYLPYMAEGGKTSVTGSLAITFTNTFDVAPVVVATVASTSNAATSVTISNPTTTGFTAYVWTGTTAATSARTINWVAYQASPTSAVG